MSIKALNEKINSLNHIVFFGGAGLGTESGIPDFRSPDGLYHQKYAYPPEVMLSHTFYKTNTEEFFRFYFDKLIYREAKPNAAHEKLAEMERRGKLEGIVTQNIDGLHQMADSKNVQELHGSIHRNYCEKCGRFFSLDYMTEHKPVPKCACGGTVKPDVVLYEESLPEETVENAVRLISGADMLIIGGTSLTVYPAAGLIRYFRGNCLALVNKDGTPEDKNADIVIHGKIGEVFSALTL